MKNKIIILIIFNLLVFSRVNAQEFPERLIDENDKSLAIDSLKPKNVVFLSTSFKNNACWGQVEFCNKISTEFADKVVFVLLIEDTKRYAQQVINDYKGQADFYNDKWLLIPQSKQNIGRLSKKHILPEFHIFKNGKLVKSFAYATKKTERKLYEYLKTL